ncbi:unnamed protein product [Owenia fusiformis]|uniref:Rho-GAP domain-containing protein n=1 Tax=Owenia fusiformis TaxID=6347 RepID=A0A8S4NRP9_OWEFU|nr:unnamed protein product [Owenia fusiformis]
MSQARRQETERLVAKLRNSNHDKFRTLCKMHLSFVLDTNGEPLDDFLGESSENRLKKPSKSMKKKSSNTPVKGAALLDQDSISKVVKLIEFLKKPENLKQEGLFRKTGHIGRQRKLKENLLSRTALDLDSGHYNAHDCASVLKSFLGDLPEPLLTENHYAAYCQIPDIVKMSADKGVSDEQHAANVRVQLLKQRKATQLLLLLLPRYNSSLLECLLQLLHKVSQVPENLMTAESLGTLFAPHIIMPRSMTACNLAAASNTITRVMAYLIENALTLFKIPKELAVDVSNYWSSADDLPDGPSPTPKPRACRKRHLEEEPELVTVVTSVNRKQSAELQAETDTEVELAKLYAHIQSLPDNKQTRKLLKKFNKANHHGTTTPGQQSNKHKRSRSLGNQIKQKFSRKHQRGRTGSDSSPITASVNTTSRSDIGTRSYITARPDITSRFGTPQSPDCQNSTDYSLHYTPPTKQIFLDHGVEWTPSSPVHIVEMTSKPPVSSRSSRVTGRPPVYRQNCQPSSTATTQMYTEKPLTSGDRQASIDSGIDVCHTVMSADCGTSPPAYLSGTQSNDQDTGAVLRERVSRSNRQLIHPVYEPPLKKILTSPENTTEQKTQFISPISQTIRQGPPSLHKQVTTPRSRKPMSIVQSPSESPVVQFKRRIKHTRF